MRSVLENLEGGGEHGGERLGGIESTGQAEPDQVDEVQRAGDNLESDLTSGLSEDVWGEEFGEGAHASHESVLIEYLASRTALLAGMLAV